jgi:hypothetical protein
MKTSIKHSITAIIKDRLLRRLAFYGDTAKHLGKTLDL